MNKERRVGRRSVALKLKLTPENENSSSLNYQSIPEEKVSNGPTKSLFDGDKSLIMRRTVKPLHEINNFQFSSFKSKSYDKLNEEHTYDVSKSAYMNMFHKHNKISLSPASTIGLFESSMVKNRREPCEPVLQSKELFNSLIDSPCTKYEKVQFNNALSSASKYLLNRHLDSVKTNADTFQVSTPDSDSLPCPNESNDVFKTPTFTDFISFSPKKDKSPINCHAQTSSTHLLIEDIEKQKEIEIDNIRQSKLQIFNFVQTQLKAFELEIEKQFSIMEDKVNENYDKLLKKVQDEKNNSVESQSSNNTVETVKEKNYSRMTGAFGILNNLNKDCSFLKTPKTKGKTREEMLNKGILTPCTMSFVLQEQLMNLNSSS